MSLNWAFPLGFETTVPKNQGKALEALEVTNPKKPSHGDLKEINKYIKVGKISPKRRNLNLARKISLNF